MITAVYSPIYPLGGCRVGFTDDVVVSSCEQVELTITSTHLRIIVIVVNEN